MSCIASPVWQEFQLSRVQHKNIRVLFLWQHYNSMVIWKISKSTSLTWALFSSKYLWFQSEQRLSGTSYLYYSQQSMFLCITWLENRYSVLPFVFLEPIVNICDFQKFALFSLYFSRLHKIFQANGYKFCLFLSLVLERRTQAV